MQSLLAWAMVVCRVAWMGGKLRFVSWLGWRIRIQNNGEGEPLNTPDREDFRGSYGQTLLAGK